MTVKVIDLLEAIEVDHHERDRFAAARCARAQFDRLFLDGAPIQQIGQRIGHRQMLRPDFGLTVDVDLVAEGIGPAPGEEDQRDIEQQGCNHDLVGAAAMTQKRADHLSPKLAADKHKHQNSRNHDKATNEVFAVPFNRRAGQCFGGDCLTLHYLSVRACHRRNWSIYC